MADARRAIANAEKMARSAAARRDAGGGAEAEAEAIPLLEIFARLRELGVTEVPHPARMPIAPACPLPALRRRVRKSAGWPRSWANFSLL
jgi:hypothetical protein